MGHLQSRRLAQYNRSVVLNLIRLSGPIAKANLAERSGLAVSSVMNIVGSLSSQGLVRMVGMGPSTGGRPPVLLEIDPDAYCAVGAAFSTDGVEAVVIDLAGDLAAETCLPLQGPLDVNTVTETIVEAVDQVVRLAHVDRGRVLGVGVACPGPVRDGRSIVGVPTFSDWRDVPLAESLEHLLGLPVTLDNDANLAALAEFRYGAVRQGCVDSLVYVYADYGIGCGVVIDGSVYRGRDGTACEMGHTVVDVDGPQCRCGSYGCLEAVASVCSIVRHSALTGKLGATGALRQLVHGDWDRVDFAAVRAAIEGGDPVALAALDTAIAYLAVGITNVVREFRPQIVVLGGRLLDAGPNVFDRLRDAVDSRPAFWDLEPVPLVASDLGDQVATIGAAALVLEDFFNVPERLLKGEAVGQAFEPALDRAPEVSERERASSAASGGDARIAWAGNLRPECPRVRSGAPVVIALDVRLEPAFAESEPSAKILLHWDRVALFGGKWPRPKNSPMSLVKRHGTDCTYRLSLGPLPPGKYEFAAHVLGANELWVRSAGGTDVNARVEVVRDREPARSRADDGENIVRHAPRQIDSETLTG